MEPVIYDYKVDYRYPPDGHFQRPIIPARVAINENSRLDILCHIDTGAERSLLNANC